MLRLSPSRIAFLAAFVCALCFALYTDHVWEDYYITYRSSKNLATGHGLVFNHGERLHTFTSPLGVLLPALASALTANSSDTAALWIFRVMCAAAFAGAAALGVMIARRLEYPLVIAGILAAFVAIDGKSLDFTINGMETAFMLLFVAYAIWAHLTAGSKQALHLGAAWAGLMWTRPDGFLYIGLIAAGFWMFNDVAKSGRDRGQLLGLFIGAGLVTTVLYLPWFLGSWWYYGTPVPHTITAKGGQSVGAMQRVLADGWRLPWLIWQGRTGVEGSFLAPYHMFPAWPNWTVPWAHVLGTIASVVWLIPGLRREARAASFGFFGLLAYLSFVPYFPFPWYYPPTTLLAYFVFAGLAAQLWGTTKDGVPVGALRWVSRGVAAVFATIVLAGSLYLTVSMARQAKIQQLYVEDGTRRAIGEWLKQYAEPGDSVFLEPLGYIGYFSGLKTHDWPGMSSRELVAAKGIVGTEWQNLIAYLQPKWLVLRTAQSGELRHFGPLLDSQNYEIVQEFSQLGEVQKHDVHGRGWLEFDARFFIYRLKNPTRRDAEGHEIASSFGGIRTIDSRRVYMAHAPGLMVVRVPERARAASGWFGFPPEAFEGTDHTDGAIFRIYWSNGKKRELLLEEDVRPATNANDRVLQPYRVNFPKVKAGETIYLVYETDPAGHTVMDHTCWTNPAFHGPYVLD